MENELKKTLIKVPAKIKKQVLKISTDRKLQDLPNNTQSKVFIELLELGLKQFQKQQIPNAT